MPPPCNNNRFFKDADSALPSQKNVVLKISTAWTRNDFFSSGSYRTFQLVSDPTWIFSNILNINFSFVFPFWECVRLHIITWYKLFREIIFKKKEFVFLNWAFLLRNCQIWSVFTVFFTSNSFQIRSCPDPEWFFPDPAKKFRIWPDQNPQHWNKLQEKKESLKNKNHWVIP